MLAFRDEFLGFVAGGDKDFVIHGLEPNSPLRPVLAAMGALLLMLAVGGPVIRDQDSEREERNAGGNLGGMRYLGGILLVGTLLVVLGLGADMRQSAALPAILCLVGFGGLGLMRDRTDFAEFGRPRRRLPAWLHPSSVFFLAVFLGLFVRLQEASGTNPVSWWGATCAVMLPALMICGGGCAVTISDGFEGLVAGIAAIIAFTLSILAVFAGDETTAYALHMTYVPAGNQWALVTAATGGGCAGIVWLGGRRARVFLGRTGSLALGGILGLGAIAIHQEFAALLAGGILVAEMACVVLQIAVFRATGGKRVFLYCPPHVHFRVRGSESQVVHRYWILSLFLAACALAWATLR